MRLTREALLKVARDTATQRARVSRRIICIYLTGSVLGQDPLLGGTTDIDLIFVHDSEPAQPREIVRLTDDIHLDIAHYPQSIFHQPRHLRTDPWLGPFIYSKPMVLHDTQHWFDFMQAATGAQFYQPDYTLQRARTLAQSARQGWMDLTLQAPGQAAHQVQAYLRAVRDAGNAVACLTGEPLTERRFFMRFPQRAQAIGHPELSARMVEMLTDPASEIDSHWPAWMQLWNDTLLKIGKQDNLPPRLQSARHAYYERAAAALWQEHPVAALWIMLRNWTEAAVECDPSSPEFQAWDEACRAWHLAPEHLEIRAQNLDQFMDMVEETLDDWGRANGVSSF